MFPSPIGELHFSINYKGCKSNGIVSVPYRGATFLNDGQTEDEILSRIKFPSPIGELHFSIITVKKNEYYTKKGFPSPIGELHFSIWEQLTERDQQHSFRPLSGSYISQWLFLSSSRNSSYDVSVPYRGATFLNDSGNSFVAYPLTRVFPSPIGELHFSIVVINYTID